MSDAVTNSKGVAAATAQTLANISCDQTGEPSIDAVDTSVLAPASSTPAAGAAQTEPASAPEDAPTPHSDSQTAPVDVQKVLEGEAATAQDADAADTKAKEAKCEVCSENAHKYKCPRTSQLSRRRSNGLAWHELTAGCCNEPLPHTCARRSYTCTTPREAALTAALQCAFVHHAHAIFGSCAAMLQCDV